MWEGFRNGELSPISAAGYAIVVVALSLCAHQALTNDDYKTAKLYLIGQRLMFLGLIVYITGKNLH
jgi:hypothetical protein